MVGILNFINLCQEELQIFESYFSLLTNVNFLEIHLNLRDIQRFVMAKIG